MSGKSNRSIMIDEFELSLTVNGRQHYLPITLAPAVEYLRQAISLYSSFNPFIIFIMRVGVGQIIEFLKLLA